MIRGILSETWLDNKGWDRIREYLPKGYGAQSAKRKNKKGRAIEGIVMGI